MFPVLRGVAELLQECAYRSTYRPTLACKTAVAAVHFTPTALTSSNTVQAHQQCTRTCWDVLRIVVSKQQKTIWLVSI